jgi:IclR family pca regulon transcriptional regulator
MASTAFEDSADYVQSLARGLQVLRVFERELPSASLSQVAERTGLARAVVRRSLLTLQHLGYVGSRGRSFFLTPRVLELGYSYLSSLDLTELAQQSMEQLAQRVGESCSMAVLDGNDIVYVLRVPVRRVMSLALGVGVRLPAFAASMGRVMLADLPDAALTAWLRVQKFRAYTPQTIRTASALKAEILRVRKQGHALVVRELEPGLCSIAVPIHAGDGHVVAALNVAMPYSKDTPARAVKQVLPALQEAQHAIEQAIRRGGWLPHMATRSAYE